MDKNVNGVKRSREVNNNKRQRDDFRFGNYRNYYNKRLGPHDQQSDLRIELLAAHPEYFRDKTVLDIGCNSGFVTINIAKKLLTSSMLGVDIDGGLVDQARRCLEKEKTFECSDEVKNALNHVVFRKANYILKDESLLNLERPHYDAILCLSVTKWIQLNYGDAGIKFMFKRIFKQLKPNGILVLESQAFNTYRKRSRLTEEISENFKAIELKPENFESYLLSDEVGFADSWCIADEEVLKQSGQVKGFQRPLQVFVKNDQLMLSGDLK